MTELKIGNIFNGLSVKKIDDTFSEDKLSYKFTIYDEGDIGILELTDDEMKKIVEFYQKTTEAKE